MPTAVVPCLSDPVLIGGSYHCEVETNAEHLMPVSQLVELLDAVFATPDTADIVAAFGAGFTVPMIVYLSAWALSRLTNFVR